MTDKQVAGILYKLHENKPSNLGAFLNMELNYYNLKEVEKEHFKSFVAEKFTDGINHLNQNQLGNILEKINSLGYDEELIKSRLKFYEIERRAFDEIIEFFKNHTTTNIAVDVSDIDEHFKGIQVASRDDFNLIINQGWTGDWVITPNSISHNKVQVASMNEHGKFPRGYYLNADIDNISPVQHGEQTRYRIFIKNAIVIDSGNRNIKFNMNPVKYIY